MKKNILDRIFNDKELTSIEKLLMLDLIRVNGELTKENCYVNLANDEIAEHLNCSKTSASLTIKSLIQKGLLEMVKFDGRTRILKITLLEK